MRISEWLVTVCLLSLALLGGAACAKKTKTLVVYDELPTTLLPLYAMSEQDFRAQELIYERVFYRPSGATEVQTDLVQEVAHRAERHNGGIRTALVLTMREDRRWADGTPVSGQDVCFTLRAILNPANQVLWAAPQRDMLTGCDVRDDRVFIHFRRQVSHPETWLMVPLLPAHRFDASTISPDHAAATKAFGTRNTKARLFEDRVAVANVKKKASPYIKRVEIRQVESVDAALNALEVGKAQGIITLPPAFWERAANDITLSVVNYSLESWWFVAVNTNRGPGRIPVFRQALDLLVDREALLSQLDNGAFCAKYKGSLDSPKECSKADIAHPVTTFISGPFPPSSPHYNDAVPVTRPDAAEGAQRLSWMGWTHATQWMEGETPVTLRLGISQADHDRQPQLLTALASQLREVGFGVQTEVLSGPWPGRSPAITERFDLFIGRWQARDPGPQMSRLVSAAGPDNLFGYVDETVEALFAQGQSSTAAPESRAWVHGLHARLAEDKPLLFLWSKEKRSVWRREFRHPLVPSPTYYYTQFNEWTWFKPR